MSKVKVGVIGVGARGSEAHVNLIYNYFSNNCTLVSICDKYQSKIDNCKVSQNLNSSVTEYVGENAYITMLKNETLDFVIIATPWEWHAKMVIECMNNGIRSGTEVPMATTEEECEIIIETYKKTGIDTLILENVCWREDVLAVLNMKRMGLFGEINFASGGYMHDIRSSLINQDRYTDWWRGEHYRNRIGDNYPTHGLGPVQTWLDVNKGNRMLKLTSYSNNAIGLKDLLNKTEQTINKYYNKKFRTGDMVKTLIQTTNGEIIEITLNTTSARPYSLDFCLQGTTGLWDRRLGLNSKSSIYLEDININTDSSNYYTLGDKSCAGSHTWDDGDVYVNKYKHPLYIKYTNQFAGGSFHGGMDWYMMNSVINSIQNNISFDISIYDSITMSIIVDLSRKSLLLGNKSVDIPDFTNGFWMNDTNYFENCFYINSHNINPYNTDTYYIILSNYSNYVHEKTNFHLYHYSDSFTNPLQYSYNSTINNNNTYAISSLDSVAKYTYLSFNKPEIRDDHYMIISTITNMKCVEFYFKKDEQIFNKQTQTYWSYLLDGRPGNDTTYIAFRQTTVSVGSNIEKIELNGTTISDNIGSTMFSQIVTDKWYHIKIYFNNAVTDDLSIFSRYNNLEDFDGAISNLIIYDDTNSIINKYDFTTYNNENRFLNTITNNYDLKVYGQYTSGIIHALEETDNLFNSCLTDLNSLNSTDIILFFKKDSFNTSDKLVLY